MRLPISQISWDNAYLIGHDEIDRDHRDIFFAVNQFILAVKLKCDKELSRKILLVAHGYAQSHFEREERLMVGVSYPSYAYHKDCHMGFAKTIHELQNDYAIRGNISEEIAYLLQNWLVTHVLSVDMEFGKYLRENHYIAAIPAPPGGPDLQTP